MEIFFPSKINQPMAAGLNFNVASGGNRSFTSIQIMFSSGCKHVSFQRVAHCLKRYKLGLSVRISKGLGLGRSCLLKYEDVFVARGRVNNLAFNVGFQTKHLKKRQGMLGGQLNEPVV